VAERLRQRPMMRAQIEHLRKWFSDIVEPLEQTVADLGVQKFDTASRGAVAVQPPGTAVEEQYRFGGQIGGPCYAPDR